MTNRFRDPAMRRQYDACVASFRIRHPDLIRTSGTRCRGNGFATYFWRGYDGLTRPVWDTNSRRTPAYACYRAGQDVRRLVEAGVYEPVKVIRANDRIITRSYGPDSLPLTPDRDRASNENRRSGDGVAPIGGFLNRPCFSRGHNTMNRQSETASQDMPDGIVTDDAEMAFDARSYIKTLTPASVGAHPERCITKGAPVLCCRFWGEARGIAQALSDPNNPKSEMLTLLDGSFKADSYNDDGEVFGFRGDWCAPPLGMPGIISELTKQADEGVENPLVEFDFEVWALPANNPTKRTWGARDMMPKRDDARSFLSDQSAQQRRIAYAEAVGGSFAPVAKRIEHGVA